MKSKMTDTRSFYTGGYRTGNDIYAHTGGIPGILENKVAMHGLVFWYVVVP